MRIILESPARISTASRGRAGISILCATAASLTHLEVNRVFVATPGCLPVGHVEIGKRNLTRPWIDPIETAPERRRRTARASSDRQESRDPVGDAGGDVRRRWQAGSRCHTWRAKHDSRTLAPAGDPFRAGVCRERPGRFDRRLATGPTRPGPWKGALSSDDPARPCSRSSADNDSVFPPRRPG